MSVEEVKERLKKLCAEESYNAQLHGISASSFVGQLQIPFEVMCEDALNTLLTKLVESGEDQAEVLEAFNQHIKPYLFGLEGAEVENNTEYAGKITYAFQKLFAHCHGKYFHIPAHVLLPDDACQSNVVKNPATLAENRKIYSSILEEKQLSTHLDDRLAELEALKANLTAVKQNLDQLEESTN